MLDARTHGRTDTKVILYSVQCYALHWTDNDLRATKLCGSNSRVIHRNVGLKCFFKILPKCLLVIIVTYAYFIVISQGSTKRHLRCGGICNNQVIANCLHSVPVK